MGAAGVVAEYDPFHQGHAYHLSETRRRLGEDVPVVCVMSGSWKQRGDCALADKWTRTALALRGGADLVLELPLPWAVSSAEGFARGAVAVLKATGVVDVLSFGSESGDGAALRELAAALESEEYREALRTELDQGNSFPAARQRAAESCLGKAARLLERPNDSLAVEYLRADGGELSFLAVPRRGVDHDSSTAAGGFASASYLRERARAGEWEEFSRWTPPETAETLQRAGVADMRYVERAFLARLRSMTEADFAALPDSGGDEGLPERLVRAARRAALLEEFYALAKTKRYTLSRVRRLALWAFLGMTADDRPMGGPAYLRVLGADRRGRALLKKMKQTATLPILTKPAHIRKMGERAEKLFDLERRATDLYGLCFEEPRSGGLDLLTGPIIL